MGYIKLITNQEIKDLRRITENTEVYEYVKKLHMSYNAISIAYHSLKEREKNISEIEQENVRLKDTLKSQETTISRIKKENDRLIRELKKKEA